MPESNLERLTRVLSELFMLDKEDLDFGIYRIMNVKRAELKKFIADDLLPQVKQQLGEVDDGVRSGIKSELDQAVAQANELGVDPDGVKKVQDLRARYNAGTDMAALENEVFSHLADFFRRYYKDGDFLSLRRYKKDVYAIPYEGEEVKLHWANADQYYIKSSEDFRDYRFKLSDGRSVHFKLATADTEKDNNKGAADKKRMFILAAEPISIEDGELVVRFEYRPDDDGRKRETINEASHEAILVDPSAADWKVALATKPPDAKYVAATPLAKHLNDYTAKNTFDYFIHKDLGGFLRRELDFYIKNEVMHLDDVENEDAPKVEQYLAKIKAIRRIAHKIIDMLAQLEDFQKKLWLKKKFVIETNYCITLDRVPEELYPEIAANDVQRDEWVQLFAIDEINGDRTQPAYSVPLTVEFLKSQPHLVLDTALGSEQLRDVLLESLSAIDDEGAGLLVDSDNFHALSLLASRFNAQIDCVCIDPPYNTGNDAFLYKDSYQHASWLAMLEPRLSLARSLCGRGAAFFITIDDNEHRHLAELIPDVIGSYRYATTVVWQKKDTPANDSTGLSGTHDYLLIAPVDDDFKRGLIPRSAEQAALYKNPDNDLRGAWTRTALITKNFVQGNDYVLVNPAGVDVRPPAGTGWSMTRERMQELIDDNRLWWGKDGTGTPFQKTFLTEIQDGVVPVTWWDYKFAGSNRNARSELRRLFIGEPPFDTPKPTQLVRRILQVSKARAVLDFFAGSGTTGHAVIAMNREDETRRHYVLVEMGKYFNTVLKPRIQKVIYSKDWKDGKPVSRQGSSHTFKYIRLESYEDTLNNLQLQPLASDQQAALAMDAAQGPGNLREEYTLKYMLDVETKGSPSLLNVNSFEDPFNYTLNIATGSAGETRPTKVDLVETFNYLIGLRVRTIDRIQGFRIVTGDSPQGEKALVIWRNTKEQDNAALDEFFEKQKYNPRDNEYDIIYVNGDNNLENLRRPDETWKVRLIEEDFLRLMFDVKDV